MLLPDKKLRPGGESEAEQRFSTATKLHKNKTTVAGATDVLADLDALAENLRGAFVVQVVVDDAGHRRTHTYRSAKAAENAVQRARLRGRDAHCSLVQMIPVGVVVGLGGGRR